MDFDLPPDHELIRRTVREFADGEIAPVAEVCRFYRDAKILTIGEGTDEVRQMVIARALGA